MFQRKKSDKDIPQANDPRTVEGSQSNTVLKYPKPHILLIDTEPKVGQFLRESGFDISEGSFGKPYRVPDKTKVYQLLLNGFLDDYFGEKEIVIIDLQGQEILPNPQGEIAYTPQREPFSVLSPLGVIDPRPIFMYITQPKFDKILSRGGVFVVFANVKTEPDYLAAKQSFMYGQSQINNWCFLQDLASSALDTDRDVGKEINVNIRGVPLGNILERHISNARFECTLHPRWTHMEDRWVTLAENKDGNPVAALIAPPDEDKGLIFLFPQIVEKAKFLSAFFFEYLLEWRPDLFPYTEGARWVERPEYEIPAISILNSQIEKIQADATKQVAVLEEQIQQERNSMGYLHTLLTNTGDELVSAVEQSLQVLGFQDIVNMDEELKKAESNGPKREDLQIRDQTPLVLVEVKGVIGTSTEGSAQQIAKNIAPRMKALKRTDIRGLSIINHQRNLPALERVDNPFSEDIIESAQHQDFGLITAWNLYKIVRNYLKLDWKHEQMVDLFYRNGFIEPIPIHYEYIGTIEHFYEKAEAVTVNIENALLRLGDRIAFELPIEFEEQTVDSLQVESKPVEVVGIGVIAGISTIFSKVQMKKGVRVFRVKP